MDDLGDDLARVGAELIRARAILPAVGGGCLYFMAWLIEIARDLGSDDLLYWLCFAFAAALGALAARPSLRLSSSNGANATARPTAPERNRPAAPGYVSLMLSSTPQAASGVRVLSQA